MFQPQEGAVWGRRKREGTGATAWGPCARLCARHGHINLHVHVFLAATLDYMPLSVVTERDAQRP